MKNDQIIVGDQNSTGSCLYLTLYSYVCVMLQDVTNLLPEWEDGNFYLAKYYDKVMPMVTDNKLEKQGNLIRYIVTYFGKYVAYFFSTESKGKSHAFDVGSHASESMLPTFGNCIQGCVPRMVGCVLRKVSCERKGICIFRKLN